MAKASSQKFIARNRAPRVQIEYDVELYGAQKKVELPFVMGVMADLSGKAGRAAAGRWRSQISRDRRRQLRRPPQVLQTTRRLPGAQHPDRRRQSERRDDLRIHGRFFTRGRGAQSRFAQQAARARAPNWQIC